MVGLLLGQRGGLFKEVKMNGWAAEGWCNRDL